LRRKVISSDRFAARSNADITLLQKAGSYCKK